MAVKAAREKKHLKLDDTSLRSIGIQTFMREREVNKKILDLYVPRWASKDRRPNDATTIDGMVDQIL